MSNKDINDILNNIDDLIANNDTKIGPNIDEIITKHEQRRKRRKWGVVLGLTLVAIGLAASVQYASNILLGSIFRIGLFGLISYFSISDYLFNRKLDDQDKATTLEQFTILRKKIIANEIRSLRIFRIVCYPFILFAGTYNVIYESAQFTGFWKHFLFVFMFIVASLVVMNVEMGIRDLKRNYKSLN